MLIQQPTLVINKKICKANIRRMAQKAFQNRVTFRPHFKTHQSHEVGNWFRKFGVKKITVSSVQMADYFAEDGWNDITIAFPLNILEINRINSLAKKVKLNLLFESLEVLEIAEKKLKHNVGAFIKIDTGYHRTGIPIENIEKIDQLVEGFVKAKKCQLEGFLTHSGNTYKSSSKEKIKNIYQNAINKLHALRKKYKEPFPKLIISVGDTPSHSIMDDFSHADEIRPGNFIFYDLMQSEFGVCKESNIASVLACPVVAKHEDRNQIVIYGGGIHFSKEQIQINNINCFGKLALLNEYDWELLNEFYPLVSTSQEHGIIQLDELLIKNINIGDIVAVIPVHSCLTVHQHEQFITETGKLFFKFK